MFIWFDFINAWYFLGEYLWRALDAARTRPTFIIDEEIVSKDK